MLIRPENRHRYPANWREIRARIRARAGDRCEACGVPNHLLGGRDLDGTFVPAMPLGEKLLGLEWPEPGAWGWCQYPNAERHVLLRIIRIVCTVAHIDHVIENCADENLRFWCQKCHLTYDAPLHAQTARRTRRAPRAVADLFDEVPW